MSSTHKRVRWVTGEAMFTVLQLRGVQQGDEVRIRVSVEDMLRGGKNAVDNEPRLVGTHTAVVDDLCSTTHPNYWDDPRKGAPDCVGFVARVVFDGKLDDTGRHFLKHQLIGWRPKKEKR